MGGLIEPIDQANAKLAVLGRGEVRWRDRGINATRVFTRRWCYGMQAALFSPRVVPGLRAFLGDALQGKQSPGVEAGTYPDLMILALDAMFSLQSLACDPSLVDHWWHLGVSSSLFGSSVNNTRFHRAFSFPFKTELPDDDADGTW